MPYSSLLKLRRAERDLSSAELALIGDRIFEFQIELAAVAGLLSEFQQQSDRDESADVASIDQLARRHQHRLYLQQRHNSLVAGHQQLLVALESGQADLIEADRAVRILEKLDDKRRLQQRRQQAAQEVRASDEAASRTANWSRT